MVGIFIPCTLAFVLGAIVSAAPVVPDDGLEARQFGGQSANDVQNGLCRNTTLFFARGTTERGNLGSVSLLFCVRILCVLTQIPLIPQVVGPPLASQLKAALGANAVAVQGINYPADFRGAIQGSIAPENGKGSIDCANQVTKLLGSCPNTNIVIAGYSQGAQQAHGCLLRMSDAQAQNVKVCQG
jgi:cutinase